MIVDKTIDLTEHSIFEDEKSCHEGPSLLEYSNKSKQSLPTIFYDNYTIEDIVSRSDCLILKDYYFILRNILRIEDPDRGYELYRLGYFCEECCVNLYHTKRRCECQECFNKRMLEENKR